MGEATRSEVGRPSGSWRRSVFWKVAGILISVQIATVFLAVVLSAWFAYDQSLELVETSLRVQLSAVAEEVEQRANLSEGVTALPRLLQIDLTTRLPDPIVFVDTAGVVIQTIQPDPSAFADPLQASSATLSFPPNIGEMLKADEVVIQLREDSETNTWGVVPLYDTDGLMVGGFVVQPLTNMINTELAGSQAAFRRAFVIVSLLSGGFALLLGAFFTWQLVRPVRRMTEQVEAIGAGQYKARLALASDDEIGRLAASINTMAAQVEESIASLRAADQLRRELIANIGHDLRTPLAALLGYLEEAQRFAHSSQVREAQEALVTAERQGHYLKHLLGDLFELSILDSGQRPLRREPIPLAELLNDAARAHHVAFTKADITFHVDLAPDLPIYEGDGVRLLRLLDNLLSNARQHTPAQGVVTLQASKHASHILIRVQDTGVGLSAEDAENIFERYYRGEGARTRKTRGTGLGLPISRAIARAHGGDLAVVSRLSEGSTFTISLPLKTTHLENETPSTEQVSRGRM